MDSVESESNVKSGIYQFGRSPDRGEAGRALGNTKSEWIMGKLNRLPAKGCSPKKRP